MLSELASRRVWPPDFWLLVVAGFVGKGCPPAGDGQESLPSTRLDKKFGIELYWRRMRVLRRS